MGDASLFAMECRRLSRSSGCRVDFVKVAGADYLSEPDLRDYEVRLSVPCSISNRWLCGEFLQPQNIHMFM